VPDVGAGTLGATEGCTQRSVGILTSPAHRAEGCYANRISRISDAIAMASPAIS
jgi:hypothetical protein